jgi:hypothetical protein
MENKWGSGLGPMEHLPDSNYWLYTLQLNVYRWFLQKHYGLRIVELCIVILHPNNQNYQKFKLNILNDEIEAMLDCRKRALDSGSGKPVEFPDTECLLQDD